MASFASLLVPGVSIPQPDTSWISGAADSIVGGIDKYKQNKSFNKLADLIGQQPQAQQPAGSVLSSLVAPQQQPQTMAAPLGAVDRSAPQGDVYQPFIDTVKTKISNPYGLAAVAATGRAESGFSSGNANRTWSDPSQSGQAGTAGGVMSWRGPRLANLQSYAASKGELGNGSPQTQAEFLLQEDPQLVQALNSAQSPEEAQRLMNNAWKFAGYDKPGGETARRNALAMHYTSQFRNQPNSAAAAIEAQAPGGMGSPLTDQSFDDRFGDSALPGQTVQGRDGLVSALTEGNAAGTMPQQVPQQVQPGAVPRDPLSTANAQPISAPPAQASAGFAGVAPIQRGGVPVELIQTMLRDPNLREIGVKLWAQNVQGPNNAEPWQFVHGKDGTLLRANQQTGEVMPIGNFAAGAGQGGDEWGLNTVWGKDNAGNTVIGQVSKSGKFKPLDTGDFTPTPGISNTDLGTNVITRNNRTGEIIDTQGKDIAGVERQKEIGGAEGKALTAAPADLQAAQNALDLIQSIRTDPNRERGTGGTSIFNRVPNTAGFDFERKVEQAKSGAFLTAIEQMRGMGALSNAEGQTATAAVTRMNTAMTEEGFTEALDDYEKIIQQGYDRAERRLSGAEPQATGNRTSTGVPWSIEE